MLRKTITLCASIETEITIKTENIKSRNNFNELYCLLKTIVSSEHCGLIFNKHILHSNIYQIKTWQSLIQHI